MTKIDNDVKKIPKHNYLAYTSTDFELSDVLCTSEEEFFLYAK